MTNTGPTPTVWVFVAPRAGFPGAVFTDRECAETWIERNLLTGVLTKYPLGVGVYDHAVSTGMFEPRKEHEKAPEFIARFTSAQMEHYHYEDGMIA